MFRFNALLRDVGIDPANVKLVRHQDTRHPERPTPYQLWMCADGRFDLYQKIQRRPVFKGAKLLASFVRTPLDETLFVGIYKNKGTGTATPGTIDPSSGKDVRGFKLYDLVPSSRLKECAGRLVITWGDGYRSWVQLARKQDKLIVEIRRRVHEPLFPGFLDFSERLSTLTGVPTSWRTVLSAVSGVYLLTHPDTGKQYVGSAQGTGGIWGRWQQYVESGDGGNKLMQDIPAADYQISVLEVASSSASPEDIAKMESRWKEKLLTRKFGLNAN